jgi:glycosyltransferase involved in cell wall biosynthesis
MDPPKLSVIITNYNYGSFVERAITSVVRQKHPDYELLVVDDGSTDNSWDVIKQTGVPALRLANGGQRVACLKGLEHTSAPFVLFLDADDELKPGSLATIVDMLDPEVAKLQFGLEIIDSLGASVANKHWSLGRFRSRETLANEVLRRGVYRTPPTSGNVFRRDVCELLRDADYDQAADGIILFAAPFFGDVVSIPEELGRYRVHERNKSGFGRAPEVASLERERSRFVARNNHLRQVLRAFGRDHELTSPEQTFYFRERSHYVDIASGRRPKLKHWMALLCSVLGEPFSPKKKIAMSLFVVLSSLLPNDQRRSLVTYRLHAGPRSAGGFIRSGLRRSRLLATPRRD